MGMEQYYDVALRCIQLVALIAGPLLLITLVVGLFLAILLAATQIQEQTIVTTIKMFVVLIYFAAGWSMIATATTEVTADLFSFAKYGF